MFTIDYISALARWAERNLLQRLGPPCEDPQGWSITSLAELDPSVLRAARLEATPERPLHILVSSADGRIRSKRVVSHVWKGPLPPGALYQLTPQVLIASPGFCLQHLCSRATPAQAASYAMEVCGSYGRSDNAPGGFYARDPLATPDELRAWLKQSGGYGSGRARDAVGHVVLGSRSPMETVVVLLFVLPEELGGCGLPAPQLNFRLEIPRDLQAAIGKPYVVVDLCWPDQRIILEYDSRLWHSSAAAVSSDATRAEGLRDEGWMVRSLTAGLLASDEMRRLLVTRVMERFGHKPPSDEAYQIRQRKLVRDLLSF